ncbi:MFS transporter [Chloroflexota bacterium]
MPLLLKHKDRLHYGWWLVIAAAIIGIIEFGTRHSYGVFFKSLAGEFDLNRATTSSIYSVFTVFCALFSLLGGWALDKYGARKTVALMGFFTCLSLLLTSYTAAAWQLFITYSLLLALGNGPTYPILMATVSRWFDKKRSLALGIAGAGGGLGMFIMSPLSAFLIADYGWRTAYVVVGVTGGLIVIFLSLLLRKEPEEVGLLPYGTTSATVKTMPQAGDKAKPADFSIRQAFSTVSFWPLWFSWLLQSISVYLITAHIVPHTTDIGVSPVRAAMVLSLIGGSAIIGRLLAGVAPDIRGRIIASIVFSLLGTVALIWLIWAHELWTFYLFALIFGLSWGGLSTTLTTLVGDVFGRRNIGILMGWQGFAWYGGAAIGPALGGLLFDATQSYTVAFIIGAVALLITVFLIGVFVKQEIE